MQIEQVNINPQNQSPQENFFFTAIEYPLIGNKQFKQLLMKWGLLDTLKIHSFRFNQPYDELKPDRFLLDLFNNPNVRYMLPDLHFPKENIHQVKYERQRCSQVNLDMFDRLTQQRLVIAGRIQGAYGDDFQGIQINSQLRDCLLRQESEHYCIYNEKQRQELLLKLFQLLQVGGSMNQYEDMIEPYFTWTKNLYKSLVTVRKDSSTGGIFLETTFLQVKKIDKVFEPSWNPQEILFVIVNPNSRVVHVIHNRWVKFW